MFGQAWLIMAPGHVRDRTVEQLQSRRVATEVFDSIEQAAASADLSRPDVAVADLERNGDDVALLCARLRHLTRSAIIGVAAAHRISAVEALRAGVDDFMAAPPAPAELAARVRALIRRLKEYGPAPSSVIDLGTVIVDCDRHAVTVRGAPVALTPKEFALLSELARHGGDLVRREELLRNVWGFDESISSRTLDVHIGRLRKKLEKDPSRPELILTVPRVGYRLAA